MESRVRPHTGAALAVAGFTIAMSTIFAAVLVVLTWLALTIYAIVKWIGAAPDAPSPTTVLLLVVSLVTALVLALTVPIALVGRSMTPRRRRKDPATAS